MGIVAWHLSFSTPRIFHYFLRIFYFYYPVHFPRIIISLFERGKIYISTLIPIFFNAIPNGEEANGDFLTASSSLEIERVPMLSFVNELGTFNLLLFGVVSAFGEITLLVLLLLDRGVTTITLFPSSSSTCMQ